MKAKCKRCDYEWETIIKESDVKCCPRCKSYYWKIKFKKDKK